MRHGENEAPALAGHAAIGIVMALLIALSYAFSVNRLAWLLRQ